ncbi:MAG: SMP-30/gluconolactonase/LRE family protein [Betaproteobacteria bacterium]|nr:SMP-30/gluconolactonase/LRE family protein [Betaproteobacteria bacterium]
MSNLVQADEVELVLDLHADIGEGPTWDAATGTLVFVDSTPGRIYRYDPSSGGLSSVRVGQAVGAAIPRRNGGLVAAVRDGIGLVDETSGALELIAPIEAGIADNRMNDAKCDSRGRLWAGTFSTSFTRNAGALYRINPDHSYARVVPGVFISNGIAWSPDEKFMYYNDSGSRGVDVFDYDIDEGVPANRRRLITFDRADGLPDGMTVDAEGHLWVAHFRGGAVRRYRPDGTLAGTVKLPVSQVASCTFGGADLRDLYITTATHTMNAEQLRREPLSGALFRCRPGVAGLPANPYAG